MAFYPLKNSAQIKKGGGRGRYAFNAGGNHDGRAVRHSPVACPNYNPKSGSCFVTTELTVDSCSVSMQPCYVGGKEWMTINHSINVGKGAKYIEEIFILRGFLSCKNCCGRVPVRGRSG